MPKPKSAHPGVKKTPLFAVSEHQVLTSYAACPHTSNLEWTPEYVVEEDAETLPLDDVAHDPPPATMMANLEWIRGATKGRKPRRRRSSTPFLSLSPTLEAAIAALVLADRHPMASPRPLKWTNQTAAFLRLKMVVWTADDALPPTKCGVSQGRLVAGDFLHSIDGAAPERTPPTTPRPWIVRYTTPPPPAGSRGDAPTSETTQLRNYDVHWVDKDDKLGVVLHRVCAASATLTMVSALKRMPVETLATRHNVDVGDILVAVNGTFDAVRKGFRATMKHIARLDFPINLTFRGLGGIITPDAVTSCSDPSG
ncbi:Aste57867_7354 [Aphanomyces stellatus]|uniref:Aste57867_7354 protein n=1 Tax=Aphanomyces stellatus TaxID=120398 RepID=A0A485KI76_9STRA|nr:hypothetical protein As57867_007328 [Aphanomyces stellatus]VFT84271.1 Aste57867_7354 [Aphanomyces stellatus]